MLLDTFAKFFTIVSCLLFYLIIVGGWIFNFLRDELSENAAAMTTWFILFFVFPPPIYLFCRWMNWI